MLNEELKEKLIHSESPEEVKELLSKCPDLDAERVWQEIGRHRSTHHEKLDLEELESISGGRDRDWKRDGCAATCEWKSWCWSSDRCVVWDVTYDNFWTCCPDGHEHVYQNRICIRCGFERGGGDFTGN